MNEQVETETSTDKDLEKEIDDWYNTMGVPVTTDALRETARHFAQWQKKQMMKNAFWCEVVGEKRDLRLIDSTERCLFDANRGDWLKIIIVKEN